MSVALPESEAPVCDLLDQRLDQCRDRTLSVDVNACARRLVFGRAARFYPEVEAAFQPYGLRYHQQTGLAEQRAPLSASLTRHADGSRPWGIALLRAEGDHELSREQVQRYIQGESRG
ncbi:hypothetical protein [Streptomyces sp. NPDC101776]|uniref:hypothetical protein n=1 Tax=Streptomyces sp. NPDC101776 TaxID=3366146 RepID=UPI00381A0924